MLRCRACGHRVARHDAGAAPGADYHAQYAAGAFLESLRATRTRQSARLLELLRRRVPRLSAVVDFGAGRGWFLDACRAAGVGPLAGLDTSSLAVEGLRAAGIEARLLEPSADAAEALAALSFRPRVVTLLDVVEHFPGEGLADRLRRIVSAAGPALELVVVKVPVPGVLYAGAAALARVGAPGFLAQLYQAGTWPPHLHYFCRRSAGRLFAEAGLEIVETWGDHDFEPAGFGARLGAPRALRRIGDAAGAALAAAIRATGRHDALVLAGAPARRV